MLRSPTSTALRARRPSASNHCVISSRNCSLWANLLLRLRIRDVAAGRNVDIVQLDVAGQQRDRVTAVLPFAPRLRGRALQRQPRQDGDAVVRLHAVDERVPIAERGQWRQRKAVVHDLRFLQTEHVRTECRDESLERGDAQAHGVDVPGDETKGHGAHHRRSATPAPMRSVGSRSMPRKANARSGGDRAFFSSSRSLVVVGEATPGDRGRCGHDHCVPLEWHSPFEFSITRRRNQQCDLCIA